MCGFILRSGDLGRNPRGYRIADFSSKLQRAGIAHTGAAEDTGHLDELNGLLAGVHLEREGVELEGWSWLVGKVREC